MFMNVLLVIFIVALAVFVAWKISPKKTVKQKPEINQEPIITIEAQESEIKLPKKQGAKRGPKKKVQD